MQGIYGFFVGDECLYIGQSVDVVRRAETHLRKLQAGRHSLAPLQEFFSNTSRVVSWRVVEEIANGEVLSMRELEWFNRLEPRFYGCIPSPNAEYTSRALKAIRQCSICGVEFKIANQRQKYCSRECYYEGRKRSHTCERCGVTFQTFATHSRYCSLKCMHSDDSAVRECERCGATIRGSSRKRFCGCMPKIDLICVVCGGEYIAVRKDSRYCSKKCYAKHGFDVVCTVCGVGFRAGHLNAKYCSDGCRPVRSRMQ